jgi:CubicO group peptidase (beta-lactamase class C family)
MRAFLVLLIGLLFQNCSKELIIIPENTIDGNLLSITDEQADLIYENIKCFPNNTEISIAIIEKETINFIGIKRVNNSFLIIDNRDNVFEIGSISKVFTSTLLANCVLENKIELADSIQKHSDWIFKTGGSITFEELANHTSGLPRLPSNLNLQTADPNNPYKDFDSLKLKEYFTEKIGLNQESGEKYDYSNLGTGTLGFTLIKVTQSTFEDLLQEKIFTKYAMENSTTNREKVKELLIKGLDPNGNETSNWDFGVLVGAGGILSSTADLSKFALAQFVNENKELLLTQKPTFTINDQLKIGLGWHIPKNKNGKDLIWHNGGTGGYSSSMALDLENKSGIIILSNVSAFNIDERNIDKLCFGLIETLGGK